MADREELDALRRMAELEARAQATNAAYDPLAAKNIAGATLEPNAAMLSGMVATPLAGLAGLAGTLAPGPEGQGAQWVRGAQNALTYQPQTEGGQRAADAVSYPFRKLGEGANYLGEKTSELTGSPAAGAAVNAGIQVGVPLGLSKLASLPGAPDTVRGKIASSLMRSAVKPTLADLQSGNAKRAIGTMLDEGINPTGGGMEKLGRITSALNDQVKEAIENSPESVSVAGVGSRLRDPYQRARLQVNPTSDLDAINAAWDEFKTHPDIAGKTEIPVQLAQQLKSGTYRALGDKSYGELASASTEAQKALARGLRETVAEKVPEVVAPLKREAALMNVRGVAERRALMEGNKNPLGLSLLAKNPYAWAGFMADKSALVKSMLARALYGSADPRISQTALTGGMVNQEQQ